MEAKLFLITFCSVFLAEFADKTQLVGLSISAKSGKFFLVWLASVLAYSVVTFISVFIGKKLGKFLPQEIIHYSGALIFIFIGILILFRKV